MKVMIFRSSDVNSEHLHHGDHWRRLLAYSESSYVENYGKTKNVVNNNVIFFLYFFCRLMTK